jgi:D-glycero-D-manno-heptose 1,7-bisphosphate phosphatase
MYPALFLDRDGVIVENRPNYIRSWADIHIFPQALEALVKVRIAPYKLIIVTNQSAVGRGLISLSEAEAINQRLVNEIEAAGGRIDAVLMCPHAPEEDCTCRKPRPGLLHQAAELFSIDLRESILIGDALSDLLAGQAAGVQKTVLVRTGRGADQVGLANTVPLRPYLVYNTLAQALADPGLLTFSL